jgi:hypothetical protein
VLRPDDIYLRAVLKHPEILADARVAIQNLDIPSRASLRQSMSIIPEYPTAFKKPPVWRRRASLPIDTPTAVDPASAGYPRSFRPGNVTDIFSRAL